MSQPRPPEPTGHRDGAFGLAERDGRVLLVKNGRVAGGGLEAFWDLPGGTTEPGEDLASALEREWAEETGLSATVGELFLVVDGAKRPAEDAAPIYTWRAFLFQVECAPGEPRPGPGIDDVRWFARDEGVRHLSAPYHAALRDALAGDPRRHRVVSWIEAPTEGALDASIPRHLLIVAAAAAGGDEAVLRIELERALAHGETKARLEEALLQIVPYAGYPRSIAAFGAARPVLGEPDRATLGECEAGDRRARGEATFDAVYGDTAGRVREELGRLHPVLRDWTLEHAYGRVLARDGVLTLRERELLAVSILTALGGLESPLLGHMRAAIRSGATSEEVAAAVSVVPSSLGPHKRMAARALLPRI